MYLIETLHYGFQLPELWCFVNLCLVFVHFVFHLLFVQVLLVYYPHS